MKMINKDDTFKLPRLYTTQELEDKTLIPLDSGQAHYLHSVLRRKDGDMVRLFNGQHGEWLGKLSGLGKKSGDVQLIEQLLKQPISARRIHLIFTPIKKNRMDWLIEKAVELGTTDFHPILTQNTEVRKINESRITAQIFEAAEQCERLEIPKLHDLQKIDVLLANWDKKIPLLACLERYETTPIQQINTPDKDVAFIIGPEGGFTVEEKETIAKSSTPVSLGETILRCETAVVKTLSLLNP